MRAEIERAAPWLALLALAAAVSLQDIRSLDYWWHLRTGELIARLGAVPHEDPYTYTVPGARWIDIHWLFQLGLHGLYTLGGHAAVVLSQLALVLVWLALLAPIGARRDRSWLGAGALALMLLVAAGRLQARPELPSFVLLAAVLRLLDRFDRTGDRAIYAIVPLQLVWANVHGLFAVGLAACAIEIAGELLRPLGGAPLRRERVRRLATATALATLACLVNPNGIDGALYPLPQLDMVSSAERRGTFGRVIDELKPTLEALGPLPLALFLALAGLSAGSLLANRRRLREADLLLWCAFLYLALGAVRNSALFACVAAPMLVRNLNQALDARARPLPIPPWVAAAGASLLVSIASADAVWGRFFARLGAPGMPGLGVVWGMNPIGAAEWIAQARPPGPIAHDMGDGGYLIWRLWPEYRVMTDGRLEVFGPDELLRLQPRDPESFSRLDAEFGFGTVLLNHRRSPPERLVSALHASRRWRLVYADDVSVVFARARSGLPAFDLDAPHAFPRLEDLPDATARERIATRARLLHLLGRDDLALRVWEQGLARFPDLPRGGEIQDELRRRASGGLAAPEP